MEIEAVKHDPVDQAAALLDELTLAEGEINILVGMLANENAQINATGPNEMSLGEGCGASILRMMSIKSHVARPIVDQAVIEKGTAGHALFGPYVKLDAGTYEVVLFARGRGRGLLQPSITVEIINAKTHKVYEVKEIRLRRAVRRFALSFEFLNAEATGGSSFEFRISSDGLAEIEITRLELWRLRKGLI